MKIFYEMLDFNRITPYIYSIKFSNQQLTVMTLYYNDATWYWVSETKELFSLTGATTRLEDERGISRWESERVATRVIPARIITPFNPKKGEFNFAVLVKESSIPGHDLRSRMCCELLDEVEVSSEMDGQRIIFAKTSLEFKEEVIRLLNEEGASAAKSGEATEIKNFWGATQTLFNHLQVS